MDADTSVYWSAVLTAGLAFMQYNAKKRDDAIDDNTKAQAALELKVAENYATKSTMMALFQETTRTNEVAIARVEKTQDLTNIAIGKQGEKLDRVVESIGQLQITVMAELSKKT